MERRVPDELMPCAPNVKRRLVEAEREQRGKRAHPLGCPHTRVDDRQQRYSGSGTLQGWDRVSLRARDRVSKGRRREDSGDGSGAEEWRTCGFLRVHIGTRTAQWGGVKVFEAFTHVEERLQCACHRCLWRGLIERMSSANWAKMESKRSS